MDQIRKNTSMAKLRSDIDKISGNESGAKNYTDDRIWKLTRDKQGNGSAVIRFLPPPEGEADSYIRIWTHGFQGPTGQYYIENSLTTLKQQDYVAEQNRMLWDTGLDSNKEIVRGRKRITNYYSNIYVVNDPANPENNDKVFLFKYGIKIFEMIQNAAFPPFPDMPSIQPFDVMDGANFRLRIRNEGRFPTYADSQFDSPSKFLSGDEDKIIAVWKQQYSLKELLDPKHFKSYEELKARYILVMNLNSAPIPTAESTSSYSNSSYEDDVPLFEPKTSSKLDMMPKANMTKSVMDDDDDDMSFFASLASGD